MVPIQTAGSGDRSANSSRDGTTRVWNRTGIVGCAVPLLPPSAQGTRPSGSTATRPSDEGVSTPRGWGCQGTSPASQPQSGSDSTGNAALFQRCSLQGQGDATPKTTRS